jgi:CheY-like chemotaxis protein
MSGQLVYVVDDEPSIALTIAAVLRISGFSAEAFTKPLEALKAARMLAPDLLISDVMMPELGLSPRKPIERDMSRLQDPTDLRPSRC